MIVTLVLLLSLPYGIATFPTSLFVDHECQIMFPYAKIFLF